MAALELPDATGGGQFQLTLTLCLPPWNLTCPCCFWLRSPIVPLLGHQLHRFTEGTLSIGTTAATVGVSSSVPIIS
jgi:hypothetical protein